jgi:hypothetical protein
LAREVWYARNFRIISPLGLKVFIGCPADGKKFLKKFRE